MAKDPNALQIAKLASLIVEWISSNPEIDCDAGAKASALKVASTIFEETVTNHMKAAMIAQTLGRK